MARSTLYNGVLRSTGQGQFPVWVEGAGLGFHVFASEAETRRFRTFYPNKRTSGEWWIDLIFRNHDEWQTFNKWLSQFFNRAANPYLPTASPIQVRIPSRNFERLGFPINALTFGDTFGSRVYRGRIKFTSASHPIPETGASRFIVGHDTASFYPGSTPGGGQVEDPGVSNPWIGFEDGETIYDDTFTGPSGGGGRALFS